MTHPASHEITNLLMEWSNGDRKANDKLIPLVYEELHRLAPHYMNRGRLGHRLQTTGLIGEAYFRLVEQQSPPASLTLPPLKSLPARSPLSESRR